MIDSFISFKFSNLFGSAENNLAKVCHAFYLDSNNIFYEIVFPCFVNICRNNIHLLSL